MQEIEKNEVDIRKLFNYGTSVELVNNKGENATLYLRLAGDSDINKSRVYGLRKSSQLRSRLKEPESDERLAYIPYFFDVNRENLVEVLLAYLTKSISQDVIKNLDMNLPKEPRSDASLEEQEKYQKVVDDWPETRTKQIEDQILKRIDKERTRLNKLTKDDVFSELETEIINDLCEQELYSSFRDMIVFLNCYTDPNYKVKAFEQLDDFLNLPSDIKEKIFNAYTSIDIGIEELKKLPGATQ